MTGRRRTPRRITGAALLLALTGALTACGDEPADDQATSPAAAGPAADAGWRTSATPVDPTGLVWLAGTTVHLDDGSTVDLAEPTEDYVVAGDGVFSIGDADPDSEGSPLLFTAPGRESVDTGLAVIPESLQASTDGRYLAAVDVGSSEGEDGYGTPQATVVAFDLETGEQVVSSSEGMGDPGRDDFADLYSESEIGPLAFVGDAVVARTVDGDLAFDLATGDARESESGEEVPSAPTIGSPEALTSPDGRWRIVQGDELADVVEPVGGGDEVVPDPGTDRWVLNGWVDDTAVGSVVEGPGGPTRIEPADSQTLLSCEVPSGECVVHEESKDTDVTFPQRAGTAVQGLGLSGEPS